MTSKTKKNMKLKINKTVTHEVDVEFPLYTQDEALFCMFTNFGHGLSIQLYPNSGNATIYSGVLPNEWMLNQQCTEENFMSAFTEAVDILNTNIKIHTK